MKIQRTIPPAAAPVSSMDFMHGVYGIVNNKCLARLEREIKEYFSTGDVFLVSSGKAALFLILSGLRRLSGKNKVIVPAYTCFSVPSAVRMAGLEIELCDISPETLDYDYVQLQNMADDDTLCILSTHLFGIPSDVPKIREIIGDRKIFIVEDAAQAMGGVIGGKKLGTLGDVAFFSLGRGKNVTSGSGGVIITTEPDIAESIRILLSNADTESVVEYIRDILEIVFLVIFIRPNLYWLPRNLPFLKIGETRFYSAFPVRRMSRFQAGLLHDWRRKLETFNRERTKNAVYYMKSLRLTGSMPIYSDTIPYNRFPLFVRDKTSKEELCSTGDIFGISKMYPSPIHKIPELGGTFRNEDFTSAENVVDTLVTFPTHVFLNDADKETICGIVRKHLRPARKSAVMTQNEMECKSEASCI